MKLSPRAKRMERRHRKQIVAAISLTALIDIFANLLFFLLVNVSMDYQVTPGKEIKLPESTIEIQPKETLTLKVNGRDLIVNGRKIADTSAILARNDETIAELKEELTYLSARNPVIPNDKGQIERDITILGDREIPYDLLKRIMATCSASQYTRISLAVIKKGET
jgi:biopolymer transport protein TolR